MDLQLIKDLKVISRTVAKTHARPNHQPITVAQDRTDTDIYICSQNEYKLNDFESVTGLPCPKLEKLITRDSFVIKRENFNSYVLLLKRYFSEYGLNEYFKGSINDISPIVDDIETKLELIHSTQNKVRIGFQREFAKTLLFDSFVGDLTQIKFDFQNKTIELSIPLENILKIFGETSDTSRDLQQREQLLEESTKLQKYQEELIERYGENGEVIHDMVKTRATAIQSLFRRLLLEESSKCMMCDIDNPVLLIASHIKPAAKSNAAEKADKDNGILLCPIHDALFDKGLITFDIDSLKVVLGSEVDGLAELYDIKLDQIYKKLENSKTKEYLKYHIDNVYKG